MKPESTETFSRPQPLLYILRNNYVKKIARISATFVVVGVYENKNTALEWTSAV